MCVAIPHRVVGVHFTANGTSADIEVTGGVSKVDTSLLVWFQKKRLSKFKRLLIAFKRSWTEAGSRLGLRMRLATWWSIRRNFPITWCRWSVKRCFRRGK